MSLFPNSPNNGQIITINGQNYIYNSISNSWLKTNIILDNTSILNSTDITKKITLDLSSQTTGITGTLKTSFTGAKTITFPDKSGTLALLDNIKAYDYRLSYKNGDIVSFGNINIQANGDIPSGTTFNYGTTDATWSPLFPIDTGLVLNWKGVYGGSTGIVPTSYSAGDVFSGYAGGSFMLFKVLTAFTSTTAGIISDLITAGSTLIPNVTILPYGHMTPWANGARFFGATSTINGRAGYVLQPLAGQQDASLKGGGDFDKTGRGVRISLANQTASGSLTNTTSVDICEFLEIPQTTSNIALTLPTPTITTSSRRLIVTNTGTESFTINSQMINASKSVTFFWSPALLVWTTLASTSLNPLVLTTNGNINLVANSTYDIANVAVAGSTLTLPSSANDDDRIRIKVSCSGFSDTITCTFSGNINSVSNNTVICNRSFAVFEFLYSKTNSTWILIIYGQGY